MLRCSEIIMDKCSAYPKCFSLNKNPCDWGIKQQRDRRWFDSVTLESVAHRQTAQGQSGHTISVPIYLRLMDVATIFIWPLVTFHLCPSYSVPGQFRWILQGYEIAWASSHLVSSWFCWTWRLGSETERQRRKQRCLLTRFFPVVSEVMTASLYQKSRLLPRGPLHTSVPNAGSTNWVLHSSL